MLSPVNSNIYEQFANFFLALVMLKFSYLHYHCNIKTVLIIEKQPFGYFSGAVPIKAFAVALTTSRDRSSQL